MWSIDSFTYGNKLRTAANRQKPLKLHMSDYSNLIFGSSVEKQHTLLVFFFHYFLFTFFVASQPASQRAHSQNHRFKENSHVCAISFVGTQNSQMSALSLSFFS